MVAGFGSGAFGSGYFGQYPWSHQVLWGDLPSTDRALDVDVGGQPLRSFIESIRPSFESMQANLRDFGDVRDVDRVRTVFSRRQPVTIVSSFQASTKTTTVVLNDVDPLDPFATLGDAGFGWSLVDADGRTFQVNAVHKVHTLGPCVDVEGIIAPTPGVGYVRPQSLIELLGYEFGVDVDRHEPDSFQRDSVRNAWQHQQQKGTAKAYDIIGKISGYRVTAKELWRVDGAWLALIPASRLFEMPSGSGQWYTDLPPKAPVFDEVTADMIPTDMMCWETPDWTTDAIVPPPGPLPDGTSVGDAIASYVQGLTVVSATQVGATDAWDVVVLSPGGGMDIIASPGHWYMSVGADQWWVESVPVDLGGNNYQVRVTAGQTPTFPLTADFGYECPLVSACDYCKASVLRIEIVPQEVLTDPNADLDNALPRMITKIRRIVPVHVRLADLVHVIGPVPASLQLTATASATVQATAYAALRPLYDLIDGDEIATDPDRFLVTGLQFLT
jgi:hypothetical protein